MHKGLRMSECEEDKTYTILPVQEEDTAEVMDLLKRTFYIHEPLNEALQLYSEDEPCPELDDYCQRSLLDGWSFKAVSPRGKIVGITISGESTFTEADAIALLDKSVACTNPKFKKILTLLTLREEAAKLWLKFPNDKTLVEIKVAATDPNWTKLGIMTKLVEETEKLTKERGIRLLRIDTSSAYSAKAADKLGFTCVYKTRYIDFRINGKQVVIPKPPHTEDKVYVKVLS